jgi:hypothetical protein
MFRKTILVLATISAAVAFVVFAALAGSFVAARPGSRVDAPADVAVGKHMARETLVGEFTGTYVDGTPVYRLAPIVVSVDRKAELARIAQEDREASAASESPYAVSEGAPQALHAAGVPQAVHAAAALQVLQK